ncbi:MAG: hypothetical protein ABI629_10455 [bacterium]
MSEAPAGVATPGANRVIQLVREGTFCFRRPSRADEAEIWRRFSRKVGAGGGLLESDLLNSYDGGALLAEAQLEVLLTPRPGGTPLGEQAPPHWYREVTVGPNQTQRVLTFDDVLPEEFDEVARFLKEAIAPKKKPPTANSTASAPAASSD